MNYTIISRNGSVLGSGLSALAAAQTVLGYDGHSYEIRQEPDGGYTLWHSARGGGGNLPLTHTRIWSTSQSRELAEADIYRKVCEHAEWFNGLSVVTDEQYARILEEASA